MHHLIFYSDEMNKVKVGVMCRLDVRHEKCLNNFKNKIRNCIQDVNLKTSSDTYGRPRRKWEDSVHWRSR